MLISAVGTKDSNIDARILGAIGAAADKACIGL
jgi:hypothetical protein